MKLTIAQASREAILERLTSAHRELSALYPGDRITRQPVHTVYGGAHLFKAGSPAKMGAIALRALDEYAGDAATFASAVGIDRSFADDVYERVRSKLVQEPVEDYRIDFEDGYGHRTDDEEDGHALQAAREVAEAAANGQLPAGIGIRIKPFSEELKARGLRTLDAFVTELVRATSATLPDGFVVTLPKVTSADEVAALAAALDALESGLDLTPGTLKLEIMVETPQAILHRDGTCPLPAIVQAGRGRVTALHFGAYDYLALLGVTAANQHLLHPACEFARRVMQVVSAGTGLWISDGATNIMPIPPHRARDAQPLSGVQVAENRSTVHRAWRLHATHVASALASGFYQGWDLHPAQLQARFAAVFAFFHAGMNDASSRLRNFMADAARATLVGDVFDDAATGQGLLNYFLRALASGAVGEKEAAERSGLTIEELGTRSFARILAMRRRQAT